MSFSIIDWTELSLQVMLTFGHFLWQAIVVAIILVIASHLASHVGMSPRHMFRA